MGQVGDTLDQWFGPDIGTVIEILIVLLIIAAVLWVLDRIF